jgi:hypothetical protein
LHDDQLNICGEGDDYYGTDADGDGIADEVETTLGIA